MTLIAWTVRLAALLTALTLVASALSHVWRRARRPARRLPGVAALAVGLSLAAIAIAFLRGDVSVFYVWENVDATYPWWLRIAGIWGGQAGTFLLWSGVVLAATAIENRRVSGRAWRRARTILLLVATVLLAAPLALHLGVESALYGLTAEQGFQLGASGPSPTSVRPAGDGLNPLLESPYMSIHPVVEFLAYGLAAVPFSYALVHLFTGQPFRDRTRPWARAAWFAFATALTLGGMWAYNVLSFGGYWIWDPVEVGNLLPFLALTVYLHADPVHRRGWLGLLTPAAAVLAFVLVLFASFVTRTGLWSSVHAFLPTGLSIAIQDPMQRLVRAVDAGFQPAFATRLFGMALAAASAGFSAFHARRAPERTRPFWRAVAGVYALAGLAVLLAPVATVSALAWAGGGLAAGRPLVAVGVFVAAAGLPLVFGLWTSPPDTPVSPRRRGGQLTLAAALLALIALATGLLLVLGVNGYTPEVFWARAPYLAAPVLALVALSLAPGAWSRRLLAVGLGLAASLLLVLATGSWAWAALPLGLVAIGGLGSFYVQQAAPGAAPRRRARAGLLLAAGSLGLLQWTSPGVLTLGGVSVASPAAYVPVGLGASVAALLAPVFEGDRLASRWLGPLAGLLAVGYGLGALLALAAGLLAKPVAASGSRRGAGLALIHAGMALLVVGVALSTYGATGWSFDQGDPLVRGEPQSVGPHTVELVDGRLVDADEDGRVETVRATVHVAREEAFVDEEHLSLSFSPGTGFTGQGSFVPDGSPAARAWWGDLALNANTSTPLSIRVDEPEANATWVVANGPLPRGLDGEVQAVSMGVERLPGINLVWAGLATIGVGFLARVLPRR